MGHRPPDAKTAQRYSQGVFSLQNQTRRALSHPSRRAADFISPARKRWESCPTDPSPLQGRHRGTEDEGLKHKRLDNQSEDASAAGTLNSNPRSSFNFVVAGTS